MLESKREYHLPQSEAEWLEMGDFRIEMVEAAGNLIRCAYTKASDSKSLVIMLGGIPRQLQRQQNLPLINKLYGHLALKLQSVGISSLLYNQPGTGGSGGDPLTLTFQSRAKTLIELISFYAKKESITHISIVGTSAGAYMALRSLSQLRKLGNPISKLVLLSPAAYPETIENVPYGEDFRRIASSSWDIDTASVFEDFADFTDGGGEAMVCYFEFDDPPIPLFIQNKFKSLVDSVEGRGRAELYIIKGVEHNFRTPETERKRKNAVDHNCIRDTACKFLQFLN